MSGAVANPPATAANRDWTPPGQEHATTGVPRRAKLDRGGQAIRAHLVLRFGEAPRPGYRALAAELGLSHQGIAHHVDQLAREGLVAKTSGSPVLTPQGRTLASYLAAQPAGESVLRRLVRQHFGRYRRAAVYAIRLEAAEMDADYQLTRDGLRRAGGDLERKATAGAILRALRRHTTWSAAARAVGLQAGAIDQRVRTLFARARRRM